MYKGFIEKGTNPEKYDAYPVLAQQSIRELSLTNRTYEDVKTAGTNWKDNEDVYAETLLSHIGRHIRDLGVAEI